jgi:pyruvate formate lyase activating enzyme
MKPAAGESAGTSVYAYLRHPSLVDYPGYPAALFFTSGCNFACRYCHNPALMRRRQAGLSWDRLRQVCEDFREEWTAAAVLSGGEPTMAEDLPELIDFFRDRSWRVKLDTNGSFPDVLARILPQVDYVALDVKAAPDRYRELTGFGEVERIRESIALLRAGETDYELRTTLIEPFHDDAQLHELADLVRGARRLVLQPFVPRPDMPDPTFRLLLRTSPDRLHQAAAILTGCAEEVLIRGD